MAYQIPQDLIAQIQISTRAQSGLPGYDPTRTAQFPSIPPLAGNIAAVDPSPASLRCQHCRGRLIGGERSVVCVYCARLNDAASPEPILFRDSIGYSWLLRSLGLDGSEMVEPYVEKNETTRGQSAPKDKISLSELLNFKISWRAESEKVENDVKNTEVERSSSVLRWNGIELDDFFLDSKKEKRQSMPDQPVISTQVQLDGSKSVTTQENPNLFQHVHPAAADVASTPGEDHEFSGWQAEFRPADAGAQNTSQLYGTSAAPPADLSTQLDSVFGSGNDSKNEISRTYSTEVDWTPDDLRNKVSSEAFPQSMHFDLSQIENNSQMQNKVEKSSTSGDWFQADDWGINNMGQPHTGITTNDDDSFADWNDFTSSSNAQGPSGSVFVKSDTPGTISHEKTSGLDLFTFDDKPNDMDVSGGGGADLFSESFSKNGDKLEVDNHPTGVSSSDRLADFTSVAEDAGEHGTVNGEYPNAGSNAIEDVQALVSEMHDLSFMLKDDLSIPSKSTDSHDFSF